MTEFITENANIEGVIVKDPENYPKELRLVLVQSNKFTGASDEFDVSLSRYDNDKKAYDSEKIKKAFEKIAQDTGKELEVPESITKDSVAKALKDVKGESIEVFVGEYDRKDKDGNLQSTETYKSLFEPVKFESSFVRKTHDIEDLINELPINDFNQKVRVRPIAIQNQDMRKYFSNGKFSDAEVIEDTKTRLGFAQKVAAILKKDESENAQKALNRLTEYVKTHTDSEGNFFGTSSGIIKTSGVFSPKSYQVKGMDEYTKTVIPNMINEQQVSGRANLSTVRLYFVSDELGDDKVFRTRPLKELIFDQKGEQLAVTFNPDDTNFFEFAKFLEPLYRLNFISDEKVNELRNETNPYTFINTITEAFIENSVMANVKASVVSGNATASILNLETPTEEELSKGTKDFRGQKSDESKDDKPSEEKSDVSQAEPKEEVKAEPKEEAKAETKDGNPFATSGDISDINDDDLPF